MCNLLSLLILLLTSQTYAVKVELEVIDHTNGKQVPARVIIRSEDGTCFYPPNAVMLEIGTEVWFMSPGKSTIDVPFGDVTLRVERGKEYCRVKEHLKIPKQDSLTKKVILKRWINLKENGYLSIENHLHRSAEDVAAMCAAEDLDFASSLQWWNRPRFGVPEGEHHTRKIRFGGENKTVSVYDAEIEEAWGALYLINLPNPFPFLNDPQMPNLFAAKYGREKGALNCYQSGWSREVLVDALLGYVDVVNVCNNNFHMHRYQPRSHYSNLLDVEGLPIYPNTVQGMMQMNTDTYYRLLNCGLRLASGAGSATGAKETPVGYNRAYVRSAFHDGLPGVLDNWKNGKNFVTNGPMLFLKTKDGLHLGDSLHVSRNKKIDLEVEVISDSPLSTLEIVVNGTVVKSFFMNGNTKQFRGSVEIIISESSWICARCTDMDNLLSDSELEAYRSPRVNLFQDPNRLRYAHTSPIYIYVHDKDIAVPKSILEGLKMVQAFKKFAG